MARHVLLIGGIGSDVTQMPIGPAKVLTLMQVQQLIMCGKFPPARMSDLPLLGSIPALLATPFPPPRGAHDNLLDFNC